MAFTFFFRDEQTLKVLLEHALPVLQGQEVLNQVTKLLNADAELMQGGFVAVAQRPGVKYPGSLIPLQGQHLENLAGVAETLHALFQGVRPLLPARGIESGQGFGGGGFQRRRPASVLRAAMPLRKEPLQKTLVTKIKAESFLPDGKKNRCAERTSLRSLLFKYL